MANKIRSLGRILLRQSESSSHSTSGSEIPTPLDAKERRRQARDPYELHSVSVASSPLFNSPSSENAQSPVGSPGGVFDPLVRAGTLLATAELDRLSFLARSRATDSKPSGSASSPASSEASPNGDAPPDIPGSSLRTSTAAASPLPQTDGVRLTAVPANTPASEIAGPATPSSTGSTKHGHRRRAARTPLPQVCMPEDAPRDIQERSGPDSGSAMASSSEQSSPGESSASKVAGGCHRYDIYSSHVPKPLSANPSPSRGVNGRSKPGCTAQLEISSPKRLPKKKLDMEHLNELLDNAISNSMVKQRPSPMTTGNHLGRQQRTDAEAKGKRARVRRSTSGTVHVLEMVGSTEGSSSGTGSLASGPPLADDGRGQEFAQLKALREQLQCNVPGTIPEKDSVEC